MISCKVNVPNHLKIRLSKYNNDVKIREFVSETGEDALRNVKEYGLGVGAGVKPTGGAPVWQGKVSIKGHYRGYLSESHYINRLSPTHLQIVSSADFVDGVMEGYSTNWAGVTFGANNYHKRAVDKLITENAIGINWRRAYRENRLSL